MVLESFMMIGSLNDAGRYSEYIKPNSTLINLLNLKLAYVGLIFSNLVRTAKKTQYFSITKVTHFTEIILLP